MFDRPIPHFLEKYLGEPEETMRRFPGLGNPLLITVSYVFYTLALIYGKRKMKSFKPFKLKEVLIFYNILQIALNLYILKELIIYLFTVDHTLWRPPFSGMETLDSTLTNAIWVFYITKIIDMMDTVFFILRKKDEQVTFLHVYHHVVTLMTTYLGTLYMCTDQGWLGVSINAAIHVLMYLYYLVSVLGPEYQKYVWWKKYLTQFQLVQFFVVTSQLVYLIYNKYARPMWVAEIALIHYLSLIILFMKFYKKSYAKNDGKNVIGDKYKKPDKSHQWTVMKDNEERKRS